MSYVGNDPYVEVASMRVLGELRSELLQHIESGNSDPGWPNWISRFNHLFSTDFTVDDVVKPIVFRDVYQVLSFPLKVKTNYTPQQEEAYVQRFKENEKKCRAWRSNNLDTVTRLARTLLRFTAKDLDITFRGIERAVRHGPGAVANHEVGDDKNYFLPPPTHMARSYPFDLFFANESICAELCSDPNERVADRFIISRLALVPKDWKGPRGVFVSPKEAVFCQLGVDEAIKDLASKSWLGDVWDPKDQTPSQECAHIGSYNKTWSTLDLSDASDLIPLSLIRQLFNRRDYLLLCATRPSYVRLPSGELHKLAMFAPMGDGKTFSVLTFVVSTLCLAAMMVQDGVLASRPKFDVSRWSRKLRVFGDDIAVHSEYFDSVVAALENHNLKVNIGKSFHKGLFRESCGYDCYAGMDVTPLRQRFDLEKRDYTLDACVSFHNRILTHYSRLVRTADYVRGFILTRYRSQVAFSRDIISAPSCLFSWDPISSNWRYGHTMRYSSLHRVEVRSLVERRVISFPDALDTRWCLNYALFPRSGSTYVRPLYESRVVSQGSPGALDYLNRHLERVGCKTIPKPRVFSSLEWLPVGAQPWPKDL
jgi:hypothetical protein